MSLLIKVIILAGVSGISVPVGAFLASVKKLKSFCEERELDSFMSAFSGGALLSAICIVLIPKGIEGKNLYFVVGSFFLGGVAAYFMAKWLEKKESPFFIYLSMLFDFIPESILLGVSAKGGFKTSLLMGVLIALQNIPEAFASYDEMKEVGLPREKIRLMVFTAPFFGPLFAFIGYSFLDIHSSLTSFILLFFSSAILYLIFEDVAPHSKIKGNPTPPLGANLGFIFGLAGAMLIGH